MSLALNQSRAFAYAPPRRSPPGSRRFSRSEKLTLLECRHAWGSTRVEDGDLSPLLRLSHLSEIRMRDRREYRPTLAEVKEQLDFD